MAATDVRHTQITRALKQLGERAGPREVAEALLGEESFSAQMRRRMRTHPARNREAYRLLARAGAEKVRYHLEEIGALPHSEEGAPMSTGASAIRRSRAGVRGGGPGQSREGRWRG